MDALSHNLRCWSCRLPLWLATAWILIGATPIVTRAQFREAYEAPETSWRMAHRDCTVQVVRHLRTLDQAHEGEASESIQLKLGTGTYSHWIQPIPSSRVIDEWNAAVWVKSNRTGIQLMARVVLPRSKDPNTGGPLRTLLRGTSYQQVGTWQKLSVETPWRLLTRQLPLLRSQFGSEVNVREAYIDLLVLNAYGGAGPTDIWIDDLEVNGLISTNLPNQNIDVAEQGPSVSASVDKTLTQRRGRTGMDGDVLLIDGRPRLLRMIEHNSESFAALKALGFNAIRLRAPPTLEQLREAEQADVWLMAPAPIGRQPGQTETATSRILAWELGDDLSVTGVESVRQRARQLRGVSEDRRRPLACQPSNSIWQYSRIADILILRPPGPGSSMQLAEHGTWYRRRMNQARLGTHFWASVPTQLGPRVTSQIRAMGAELPVPLALEPDQIRLAAYHAIASGVRGLLFRSRSPLTGTDRLTLLRAKTLQLLNQELQRFEPWATTGKYDGDINTNDRTIRVSALKTRRSRLLLIIHRDINQQYVVSPVNAQGVSFEVYDVPETDEIYRINPRGMHRVRQHRGAGVRITLDEHQLISAVVLTQDPLAISFVARTIAQTRQQHDQLLGEIASQLYAAVVETQRQLARIEPSATPPPAALEQARTELQHFQRMVEEGGHDRAYQPLERGLQHLAAARVRDWNQAVRSFPSPVSSPLCVSYFSLPQHYALSQRLRGVQWGPNAMAAGDFENLSHMQSSGWRNECATLPELKSAVELSLHAPHAGRSSLRLRCWLENPRETVPVLEAPPIRIVSAPVPVRRGQLVRIHGWVRVPQRIQDSLDGLLIHDSLGGLELAQRVLETNGWQPFTFYRAVERSGSMTLTFALTGLGEAWLDDVTVSTVDGPGP